MSLLVDRIEAVVKSLVDEMAELATHLTDFDAKNASGVEDLYRLDILKTNLESCRNILQQHHQWNALLDEAKAFIEGSGKLSDSADRLELMQKSLEVLAAMPGHEERTQTCITLRENLLASFLPTIRKGLLAVDLSPVHEYIYVYRKIGR